MATVVAFESKVVTIPGILAGANLSDNQYYAVKFSSGKVVICTSLGESPLGILQNAPAADGDAASVAFSGIGKAKIGGSVSQMNRLVTDVDAMLINQTDPDEAVIAMALSDGSDGDVIPVIYVLGTALNSAVVERALANTKIWIGDSAGEAQAFAMSGHATMTAGGVVTVTDLDTTAASDASGDLIYRDSGSTFERLAKGTTVQILAMNSGATAPEWIDQSAITSAAQTDIGTTAAGDAIGDVLYRDAADTFERLAIGTAAQILATNGGATAPEWIAQSAMTVGNATAAATATDVVTTAAGDAIGDLLYRDAAATLERLAIGTASQILQTNAGATAPEWNTLSGDGSLAAGVLTVDNVTVGADASGDINYKTAATTTARLAKGTAGQTIRMNAAATAPEWGAVRPAQVDPEFAEDFTAYGAGKGMTLAGLDGLVGGATGAQLLTMGSGIRLIYVPIVGQTISPITVATGLDIQGDQVDNDGLELVSGMLGASGRPMRIGTDAAFFFKCSVIVTEPDGTDDLVIGWRKAEGHRAAVEDYTDMAALGCNTAADPMLFKTRCMINNNATTNTDTTDTDAFGDAVEFHILVSAAGVVTFEIDSGTPSSVGSLTFDDGDLVVPFFSYLQANADQTASFIIDSWEVGYS